MRKFILLLVLFAAGCMTADDRDCKDPEKVVVHDTVRVVDTLHDTTRVLVSSIDEDSLLGIWRASYKGDPWSGGKSDFETVLAVSASSSILNVATFTGTRKEGGDFTVSISGEIESLSNGLAKIRWTSSRPVESTPSSTWAMRFQEGSLIVEEIGGKPLRSSELVTFKR